MKLAAQQDEDSACSSARDSATNVMKRCKRSLSLISPISSTFSPARSLRSSSVNLFRREVLALHPLTSDEDILRIGPDAGPNPNVLDCCDMVRW
jgi:hypothetical protein